MANDISLECSCGKLKGRVHDVSPDAGFHLVCYCDDCQAFARFLGREEEMLDASGGTDIFQTSPARLEILEGEFASMRLSPKGLLRWYSACCRSPIGNTINGALPFVGLLTASFRGDTERLGPVRARVMARFAEPAVTGSDVCAGPAVGLGFRLMGRILMSRLRGEHKKSPFFDAKTRMPVSAPHVLSEAERKDLASRSDGA